MKLLSHESTKANPRFMSLLLLLLFSKSRFLLMHSLTEASNPGIAILRGLSTSTTFDESSSEGWSAYSDLLFDFAVAMLDRWQWPWLDAGLQDRQVPTAQDLPRIRRRTEINHAVPLLLFVGRSGQGNVQEPFRLLDGP